MISLRLLSLLLDENINYLSDELDGNLVPYEIPIDGWVTVNVFELAHKAKEWAYDNGFEINSHKCHSGYKGYVVKKGSAYPIMAEVAPTEPEVIFLLCKFLLKDMDIELEQAKKEQK